VRRRGRPRNHLALSRSRSRVHLGPGANNSPFVTNLIATRSEQTHDVSISVRRLRAAGLRIKQWSRRGEAVHLSRALLNLSRRSLLIIPAERRYFSKPSSPRHAIPTLLGVSLRGLITFLERWSRLLLRKLLLALLLIDSAGRSNCTAISGQSQANEASAATPINNNINENNNKMKMKLKKREPESKSEGCVINVGPGYPGRRTNFNCAKRRSIASSRALGSRGKREINLRRLGQALRPDPERYFSFHVANK
jgi:hypothetical protein